MQTRRLFGSFNTELQSIDKMIDEMLALAQGMRKAVANTTLYIAEIEHRYVEQSADKRKSDKLLHDATERLKDFVASAQLKSNVAIDIVKQRGKQIDALATQAHRIANERFVADNERTRRSPIWRMWGSTTSSLSSASRPKWSASTSRMRAYRSTTRSRTMVVARASSGSRARPWSASSTSTRNSATATR